MLVTIPVSQDHIRSITDPIVQGARTVYALVRATDLPELPLNPDPRIPKATAQTTIRIKESLASNRGDFHLLNRGITVSAKSANFDQRAGALVLDLPDKECYGILDGGHTDFAIREKVGEMSEKERHSTDQFVRLEIMVGVEDHLADIAEARNYSISLKASTLAGYRHKFDWLLEAIGPHMSKYVRISENNEQPVSILDVLQVLTAMNLTLFPESQAPLDAYKNAAKCLTWFIEDDGKRYRKLTEIAPTILNLYDYCRLKWHIAYNAPDAMGRRGRFGATVEAKPPKRNLAAKTTYYFYTTKGQPTRGEYAIDKGLAIPLLSGFRALLQEDEDGQYRFYADPFKFFDEHGQKIVTIVMKARGGSDETTLAVGRDPQVYDNVYSEVRRWYLESQFRGQGTKARAQLGLS